MTYFHEGWGSDDSKVLRSSGWCILTGWRSLRGLSSVLRVGVLQGSLLCFRKKTTKYVETTEIKRFSFGRVLSLSRLSFI